MNFRTRVLGAASVLVLSGGMIAATATSANAVVTPTGNCVGALNLTKIVPGLTDQTTSIVASGAVTTNSVTKAKNAGVCANTVNQVGNIAGAPPAFLTPKAIASKLVGNSSCASGAAIPVDATRANAYTLNGMITYTMNELTPQLTPWKIQAYIGVAGFDPAGLDVIDIHGFVAKGASFGSDVSGTLYEDPAIKSVLPDKGMQNSGYTPLTGLTLINSLVGCTDAIANNVQLPGGAPGSGITSVLVGDGISPSLSSVATGIKFTQGQP